MKEFLKLLSSLLLIYFVYVIFKWIWDASFVGKLVIIAMFAFAIHNYYRMEIQHKKPITEKLTEKYNVNGW